MENASVKVSVIIPFLNEEGSIKELISELVEVMEVYGNDCEMVFVDDGSTDQSSAIIESEANKDLRIKLIRFRKNFGQTAAWAAGINYAKGAVIVFMDADRQNDSRDIPMLVDKIVQDEIDVASGWRKERHDKLLTRKIPSWIANKLISIVTGVHLHDYGCSLKAYKGDVLRNVRLYGEMHRFLPAYVAWEGAKIIEVPVRHHARKSGVSKYGMIRTFKVLLDLITVIFLGGFATKPIYFFGSLGGLSFLLGMFSFSVVAFRVLVLESKEATPMVFMMVIFFISSLQFILMGLLAEIAVRIYHEAQAKEIYRILDTKNVKEPRRVLRSRS